MYLHYGDANPFLEEKQAHVWDLDYKLVLQLDQTKNPDIEIPHADGLAITEQITVETWAYSDHYQAEALQSLVSKWSPLSAFDNFAAYDAGNTDGFKSIAYFGAVFDGRYIYFSPQHYKDWEAHGIVLRYDTHNDFQAPTSYAAYDAGHTDGLKTRGYYGAIFDGRYVYFVPRQDETEYHSRVLRYDTHRAFKDVDAWEAYDAGEANSHQGVAFDGRYIYFSPGFAGDPRKEDTLSAKVLRYDTRAGFKEPTSWRTFDASQISDLVGCFDGAAFDGRYVYFVPLIKGESSTPLRYDTKGDFGNPQSWSAFDAAPLGMETGVGAVFDGRYIYYVPYLHSTVVRYDTQGSFTSPDSWHAYDAGNTSGLNTGGFDGGFFDGRYIYFVPFVSEPFRIRSDGRRVATSHCNFLRYDSQKPFYDPASWEAHDASQTDGLRTKGYNAGAFDGRYFYLTPWQDTILPEPMHGRVLRYDTLGENGSFSLRYCDYGHNGGLCAAVPGPSFIVNTVKGPLSIAAHQALLPGWHHIVGVYNGSSIKLFIDGVLAGERIGSGAIQMNDAAVMIGRIQNGSGQFHGIIDQVRISDTARTDDWIKTSYRTLVSPSTFVRLGKEEIVE